MPGNNNKKRFRSLVQSNPPETEAEVTLTTGPDISELPAEIIQMILSKLSHGNQLWARLVCKQWNELITIDVPSSPFLNKSVVRVCVNTNNRDIILKNSVVKWRHLYLKDLRSSGQALPIIIPLHLMNNIQTVKISHAEVTWKGFQQILIQFPSLRGLKISRSEITRGSMGSWKSMIHSKRHYEFETILTGLSSLTLSRLVGPTLDFFVCRFFGKLPFLATFELKCECYYFPDMFPTFIESVSPTLKNLCVTIGDPDRHDTIKLFVRRVLQRLNESDIAKIYFNLETFSLRYNGPYRRYKDKDLRALLGFLKMNKNLKRFCGLPENNSNLTIGLAREFIRELPRDLVAIDVPGTTYLSVQGNLLRLFGKLESIRAGGDIRPFDLNLDGLVLPTLREFENCLLRDTMDMELIVKAFPNLVTLQATISAHLNSMEILQEICRHLKLLVSLELTYRENSEIMDSGVTGISSQYCMFLQYRSLYSLVSLKDDPIPEEHVTGVPLSCLRRLEKLTIRAHRMNISNAGLCFGFRFVCLKKLSLANIGFGARATRITPGGLRFIADYNRSLEEVSLHNIVRMNGSDDVLGSEAVKNFKNRMDRCKSFRMKITRDPDPQSISSDDDDSSDISDVSWG